MYHERAVTRLLQDPEWRPGVSRSCLHRQAEFFRGLFLRGIHRHEPLDRFGAVEPESRSQMHEIERSGRCDRRNEIGLAEIARQITQLEQAHVLLKAIHAGLVLTGIEGSNAGEANQVAPGFQQEEDARQELSTGGFGGEPIGARFAEEDTEVRRGIDVEAPNTGSLPGETQRSARSSLRTAKYRPFVARFRAGLSGRVPTFEPRCTC